ncbi:uncharacterized protein CELE_F19C6.5 [Caenorhabditis elegans]|uniref:Uncharacterized protein F19C6.5 n=1 Tax=Caenorhabditis elegans TaxID=6239 RepID=YQR5_CAEEL|nr:Uncharacterized protein CELE_F19C6.5 [Caenorhabditis elegans]Q09308.1 RecName: Full=Uncharacterized protein F19C6.5 [Caenorhabditis elegans]CAA88049.1 Uncharacterized protein CELE_F19C6.5 [Caenorhabditis elegans]|eukprot:NP_509675.1 Uncharacterized protein CELE_F19C6.5 [Caenorhabditis elegans]
MTEEKDEYGTIVVARVAMEENMFNPQPDIPRIRNDSTHSYQQPESMLEKLNTYYTLAVVIAQLTIGVLGNSLTLVADATRIFADHLELFQYDRAATPGKRLTEIITVGITNVILFLLFVAFLLTASGRAATMEFDINRLYLSIGTAMAMTANTLQTLCHFRTWQRERSYHSSLYTGSKRNQLMHGFVYHFIAYFVLVSSLLIIVNKDYLIADVITTYATSLLILANISSIGYQLYHEYFSLEHPQDEYEPI